MNILSKFKQVCKQNPKVIALACADQSYTYQQMDMISDEIAFNLLALRIQPGARIGLLMDRTEKTILIIFGVLKIGCTYVPLSKENPIKRIKYMQEIANLDYIIGDDDCASFTEKWIKCNDLLIPNQIGVFNDHYPDNKKLYTIFTSGTTGKPKAFDISQAAMCNLVESLEQCNWGGDAQKYNVIGELAELVFDMSQAQIYLALLTGRTLDIIPTQVKKNPRKLSSYLEERKITHCDITPTLLEVYENYLISNNIRNNYPLTWTTSGEKISLELVQKVINYSKCRIVNSYGPAEACVYVSTFTFDCENINTVHQVPIGRPILNTNLYILNEKNEICDAGIEGEIAISGIGVTDGYIGMQEYTAKVLIKNPVGDGYVYKTGDIGKYSSSDDVYYCFGRKDNQIKYHGIRIELEEIESVIKEIPDVLDCKVFLRQFDAGKRLVAYYVSSEEIEKDIFLTYLKENLPANMFPNHFLRVDKFRATVNGKFDESCLPLPEQESRNGLNIESTAVEREFLGIVRNILYNDNIGLDDNFFYCGGDSLSFISLIVNIEDRWKIAVPAMQLYKCDSIGMMCSYLSNYLKQEEKLCLSTGCKKIQLRDFQRDIIFAEKKFADSEYPSHNIIQYISCNRYLEPSKLAQACEKTIKLFDALHSSIVIEDGEYYLTVNNEFDNPFQYVNDIEDLSMESLKKYVTKFKGSEKSLIKIILFEAKNRSQKLVLNAHHTVFDFVSVVIFLRVLLKAYCGVETELVKRVSFYDALLTESDDAYIAEKKAFWKMYYRNRKKNAYFAPDLEDNIKIQPDDVFYSKKIVIKKDMLDKIKCFCNGMQITCFQLILAIFGEMLAEHANTDDVIIGTFLPGRSNLHDKNLFGCVGLFTTCMGIRIQMDFERSKSEYLRYVKQQYEKVLDYQDTNLREVFKYLDLRDLVKGELFKVLINYHSYVNVSYDAPDGKLELRPVDISQEANNYPINITVHELEDKICVHIGYAIRLYSEERIEQVSTLFLRKISFFLDG